MERQVLAWNVSGGGVRSWGWVSGEARSVCFNASHALLSAVPCFPYVVLLFLFLFSFVRFLVDILQLQFPSVSAVQGDSVGPDFGRKHAAELFLMLD